MHAAEYLVYRRWIDKWLPQIVYGSDAGGAGDAHHSAAPPTPLSALPGGRIVGGR